MSIRFPDTADYLIKHDIVYQSPPTEGWEAFPLGNGSLGGPLWMSPKGLIFQVNHTDSYELPDPQNEDEPWAILRSCGRLTIECGAPIYDWLYLKDFHGSLCLGDATSRIVTRSAFGDFDVRSFVHAERPVVVFDVQASYSREIGELGSPINISLEHWGSRICGWWYSRLSGDAEAGLAECRTSVEGNDTCLNIDFRGASVSLRCRVIGAECTAQRVHGHEAKIEVKAALRQSFRVLVACVTSQSSSEPARDALLAIEEASDAQGLHEEHVQWWRNYWSRSFLHIGHDYFENLYYLHLYLMGCSARGKFPPLFNGGLWTWNRDVRNWVNPHHWNQQQAHWCLPAADRLELLSPYLRTYGSLRDEGVKMAQRKGYQGMLWSEMHDFFGRQLSENYPSMMDNFTPAAQTSLFFWWHYQFSGDVAFLREHGYAFIRSVAEFYVNWITWNEASGQYELPLASTYEEERHDENGRPMRFTNTITNLAMIRAVFSALVEASEIVEADGEMRVTWRHILDHLPPFIVNDHDKVRGVTLASGYLHGQEVAGKEDHVHGPLFCPIMPAGVLGLADEGSSLFKAAQNTILTYPPDINAITPTVIVAARLGLAEEVWKRLKSMVRNLQHFPTGMFFNVDHWFIYSRRVNITLAEWRGEDMAGFQRDYIDDAGCRFRQVQVSSTRDRAERLVDTPIRPFIQPGLESLGHFAAGIQEMLLQSHDGTIRVFPAIPDEWQGSFSLLATGGFEISSRRISFSPPAFISIKSRLGGPCSVASPWKDGVRVWHNTLLLSEAETVPRVVFQTQAGEEYILTACGVDVPDTILKYQSKRNTQPKHYHEASIGKVRDF